MRAAFLLAAAVLLATPAFAADDDTLTIGMTLSQTGPFNVNSLAQQRGAELWRDQVNEAGGIKVGDKHYKVRFVTYDDQSQGGRVQQLYTRLIVQDKAQFLFSPYSSGLCATAAVISEQYGKLMLITGGAEPKTYTLGNKYLVQVISSADHYLTGAIDALESKAPHAKVAFVYSDDPFSKAVTLAAREQAKESGFNDRARRILRADDDRLQPDHQQDHLVVGRCAAGRRPLCRRRHARAPALRSEGQPQIRRRCWWRPTARNSSGSGRRRSASPCPRNGRSRPPTSRSSGRPAPNSPRLSQDKFKTPPDYHAASGYAGGVVLQHAIEQAGSIDADKVVAALNGLDVTTFFGHFKIATDPGHHGLQIGHEMVLAQWQKKNGQLQREVVWPKAAQTADLLYPLH